MKSRLGLAVLALAVGGGVVVAQDKPAKPAKPPIPKILLDRLVWNKASEKEQDAAIKVVGQRLGEHYKWVETKVYECDLSKHRIATFQHKRSGLMLNLIPGGTYTMGSNARGKIDERPAHKCKIPPMLFGKFEVRQSIFDKIGGAAKPKWKGPDKPVEKVSWNAAVEWTKRCLHGIRLPSEAEWEYACRAGSTTPYYWGFKADPKHAWYRRNSKGRTHNVTEHDKDGTRNAFGLVDMLGNVSEWTLDDYIRNYEEGPYDHKPRKNPGRGKKVIRGGCWLYPPANTMGCADRIFYTTGRGDYILGFRVCADI